MTRGTPWGWRPCFTTGAPRTCLSNYRVPVLVTIGDTPLVAGDYDALLRLYQHRGTSRQSVLWEDKVAYRLEEEWHLLKMHECEWLEFVDDRERTVSRLDFGSASRYGSQEATPHGQMWTVPRSIYTTLRGD